MRASAIPPPLLPNPRQQGGFALVVGLLLLLVLTILGVSAMRGTTLQERMASNMQDREIAFQSAEAALRAGEAQLQGASLPVFNDTGPYYSTDSTVVTTPRWQTIYGSSDDPPSAGSVVDCTSTSSGCSNIDNATASFFIEKLQNVVLPGNSLGNNPTPPPQVYRVSAAASVAGGTSVILQSTVIR